MPPIDIDVRTQNDFSLTGIIFADNKKIVGTADSKKIFIEGPKGQMLLCDKDEIDMLIKALEGAKKVFGVI